MKFRNIRWSRFDLFLSEKFESLGSWIARSPGIFILVPILLTLLTGSGVQKFVYASDVFYLFVPVDAQSIRDATTIRSIFPRNVTRHVPGSETGRQEMMEVILLPRPPYSALSRTLWAEAVTLTRSVEEISGRKTISISARLDTFLSLQ